MKKVLLGLLCAMLLFGSIQTNVFAEKQSLSWYCQHVKEHRQPPVDPSLAFVESMGGYYADRANSDPNAKDLVIYLTFDAGYENGNVEKTLDILQKNEVEAAFFVLGNLIEKNTDLVKRMAEEGHLVCNHTVRHKDMSNFDEASFAEELQALEILYKEKTGYELAHYYRPPEGRFSQENLAFAEKLGYKTIFWSFAYPDWDNNKQMNPEKAKQIIMDNLHNGEVMLLHPTSKTNAAILDEVIQEAKDLGYRFASLDELVGGTCE